MIIEHEVRDNWHYLHPLGNLAEFVLDVVCSLRGSRGHKTALQLQCLLLRSLDFFLQSSNIIGLLSESENVLDLSADRFQLFCYLL
jgi:hypothetical protein